MKLIINTQYLEVELLPSLTANASYQLLSIVSVLIRIGIGEGNFRYINGIKMIQRTVVFSIENENVFYY